MRAAFITEPGPSEAIQVGELAVPVPGPTVVLVAIEVSALNPADTFIRSGRYPTPMPLPFVVGRDLVGTVTAVCPGSGFAPGERVWCNSLGHGGRQGLGATYTVVPADRLYPLPDGAEPAEPGDRRSGVGWATPRLPKSGLNHRRRLHQAEVEFG
jgi:NADPH:quinone reductase-like Zn-dependent oxidoreductase